jgi:hypothetical protein
MIIPSKFLKRIPIEIKDVKYKHPPEVPDEYNKAPYAISLGTPYGDTGALGTGGPAGVTPGYTAEDVGCTSGGQDA